MSHAHDGSPVAVAARDRRRPDPVACCAGAPGARPRPPRQPRAPPRPWHDHGHGHGKVVDVMTRNLYLGADLTPAIGAPSLGSIRRRQRQDPARSHRQRLPDPGQGPGAGDPREEARPGRPAGGGALAHRAAQPRSRSRRRADRDHGPLRLPAGTARPAEQGQERSYEVVVSQNEFDFEAPADENGSPATARGPISNAEINGRLTMRDVILARHGAGVRPQPTRRRGPFRQPADRERSSAPGAGRPAAGPRPTPRSAAASRSASSTPTSRRSTRRPGAEHPRPAGGRAGRAGRAGDEQPAGRSWSATSTPTTTRSNRATGRPTTRCSRRACVERSTNNPLGCCLNSSLLAEGAGGSVADFDHQVDHVMTREPEGDHAAELSRDRPPAGQRLLGLRPRGPLQRPELRPLTGTSVPSCTHSGSTSASGRASSALAGGVGDEFGDFFGLLAVEDAGRHPARGGAAVDAVFDRVEDAAFGRLRSSARRSGLPAGRRGRAVRRGSARSCRRCRPRRACGRCRSWSGRGSALPSGRPALPGLRVAASPSERKASQGIRTARKTTSRPKTMKVFLLMLLALICARHGTRGTSGAARTPRSAVSGGRARARGGSGSCAARRRPRGRRSPASRRGRARRRPLPGRGRAGRRPGGCGRRPGSPGCPR